MCVPQQLTSGRADTRWADESQKKLEPTEGANAISDVKLKLQALAAGLCTVPAPLARNDGSRPPEDGYAARHERARSAVLGCNVTSHVLRSCRRQTPRLMRRQHRARGETARPVKEREVLFFKSGEPRRRRVAAYVRFCSAHAQS